MIKTLTFGKTGIKTPQNAFGALPIQRVNDETAVRILRKAYEGGMTFFDTARAYTDSEHKMGLALSDVRDKITISTKTMGRTPEEIEKDLNTSLNELQTDYVDVYQLHFANVCYRPGDGTGVYEYLEKLKADGKIRHIGITTHRVGVAEEIVESGLYESLQYPFSYLVSQREHEMIKKAVASGMGFLAMKGLAGGLLTNSEACMAFMLQNEGVLPIWGIQKEEELDEWLAFMENPPTMTKEIEEFIENDRSQLLGNFCRGCGYCSPCPKDINISQCARISLMLRRAPEDYWLSEPMQKEMEKTKDCIECGACIKKCPYNLPIPTLLKENYKDYQTFF